MPPCAWTTSGLSTRRKIARKFSGVTRTITPLAFVALAIAAAATAAPAAMKFSSQKMFLPTAPRSPVGL
jgi:hypothetical protein